MAELLDKMIRTGREGLGRAADRVSGIVVKKPPVAMAGTAVPSGDPTAKPVTWGGQATTSPGLSRATRVANAVGNASTIAKLGGALQGGMAAKSMVDDGVGVDNTTSLASGAAKFAGPVGVVGSTAFDVGKAAGKSGLMPDSVAMGLAKATNWITGNGSRNNTESTLKPNMAEINRIAEANPNGLTAARLAADSAGPNAVQPPAQAPVAPTSSAVPAQVEAPSKFEQIAERLASQQGYQPVARQSAVAAQEAPPKLDTSMVAGDSTGLATMAALNSQRGLAADWSAGMKRARGLDAQNMAYDAIDARGRDEAAQREMQGLGKAADIYALQAQRQSERAVAANRGALEQRDENEKRINSQMDRDFGPSTFKDGKDLNEARTRAELQMQTVLGRVGKVRGDLNPQQYQELRDAIQTGAAGDQGWLADFTNKIMGYNGATTNDAIKATQTTGERGPGGIGEVTADGRVKWADTLRHGGLFGGGNQEAIERSRRDNEEAARAR